MKKNIYTFLLFVACLLGTTNVHAAVIQHRLGVSLEGGYAINIYFNSDTHSQGGAGALGGVYEMQYNHFLFHTVLSAQYEGVSLGLQNQQLDVTNVVDEVGDVGTRHYHLNAIEANDQIVMPCLSIMAGGDWDRFYFLMGVKLGADVFHQQRYQTSYSVTATYPFFDTELGDMPQHALVTDVRYASQSKPTISLSARVGGEIGTAFAMGGSRSGILLRVGAFGEYAIPFASSYQPEWTMPQKDYTSIAYNELSSHVLSSFDQMMNNGLLHSQWCRLIVGIRGTLLFNLGAGRHYRCMCTD